MRRQRPLGIDDRVSREQADDDTVRTFRLGGVDVGLHDSEFVVVKQEVAAARTDDDM